MNTQFDYAIVGGGIVGLAHAWTVASNGQSVVVFERDPVARGASVRNFGMIWPIGQPSGELRELAMIGRRRWCEVSQSAGFWLSECGSIHLAHRQDEWNVLEEFVSQADTRGYDCELLDAGQVAKLAPGALVDGLIGGLHSRTELCIDPREAMRALARWLEEERGVQFRYGVSVREVDYPRVITSDGARTEASEILVTSGSDLATLYPQELARADLRLCKLQMLRTGPQPARWSLGPHLAGGLTLRHYPNFAECPSLAILKKRISDENPLLDQFGIHVMAAQNGRGEVLLGDSHEYGPLVEPTCRADIDDLILSEAHKLFNLADWTIDARWHGTYLKHRTHPYVVLNPQPGVRVITGVGGGGMTLSFGIAERNLQPTVEAVEQH